MRAIRAKRGSGKREESKRRGLQEDRHAAIGIVVGRD